MLLVWLAVGVITCNNYAAFGTVIHTHKTHNVLLRNCLSSSTYVAQRIDCICVATTLPATNLLTAYGVKAYICPPTHAQRKRTVVCLHTCTWEGKHGRGLDRVGGV